MTTDIISPSEISSELSRLWDTLEGTNKMRASLFNLIFYTKKNARAPYIHTISEKVIEKFPSRVLFITENPDEEQNYLNTRVSVVTSQEGQSEIACDSIQIEVAGTYRERVPFVLLPHILPDLPVYVIWAETPCEETPLFLQLQKLASRMIFDSECIEDLSTFAKTLVSLGTKNRFDIADLNWARVESWRQLLTTTFYPKERLEMLQHSSKIQIFYNAKKSETFCHTPIQSLYLQGWLASQLNWQLQSAVQKEGKWTLTYQGEKGPIEILLYPETHQSIKPGTIVSVDLETAHQDHFSFGCNLDQPHQVYMRFSTLEKCNMPLKYIFDKEESGKSLVKEICHRGTSHHFLNLLERLSERKEFSLCAP